MSEAYLYHALLQHHLRVVITASPHRHRHRRQRRRRPSLLKSMTGKENSAHVPPIKRLKASAHELRDLRLDQICEGVIYTTQYVVYSDN